LEYIDVGTSLQSIAGGAFSNTANLNFIFLPDTLTSLSSSVFAWSGVRNMTDLPESITVLSHSLFRGSSIERFHLGSQVTSITGMTFYECGHLPSIIIGNASLESIGDQAFCDCGNLQGIDLNDDLESIRGQAFGHYHKLNITIVPRGVTIIQGYTFWRGQASRRLQLSPNLRQIEAHAFRESGLEYIDVGNSLQSIGDSASFSTANLHVLFLPDTLTWLGSGFCSSSGAAMLSFSGNLATVDANAFSGSNFQVIHLRGELGTSICTILSGLTAQIYVEPITGLQNGDIICESRTVMLVATPTPAPSSTPVALDPSNEVVLAPKSTTDLVLQGSGSVRCEVSGFPVDLEVGRMTIFADSHAVAKHLVVKFGIELGEGASLSPPAGESIRLMNGVSVLMTGTDFDRLPLLDLGEIGESYSIVPSEIEIRMAEDRSSFGEFHRLIVKGRTLSNCEEWKERVSGLPSNLMAMCEPISGEGARLLAGWPEIGLFVGEAPPTEFFTLPASNYGKRHMIRVSFCLFLFVHD
jgi:hypothetical protein